MRPGSFTVQLPEKHPWAWKGGVQVFEKWDAHLGSYAPKPLVSRFEKWGRMDKWFSMHLVSEQIC